MCAVALCAKKVSSLDISCQALITNKEVEAMHGWGWNSLSLVGAGGSGQDELEKGGKWRRSERLQGKWVNRLARPCASSLFINTPGGVDGAL